MRFIPAASAIVMCASLPMLPAYGNSKFFLGWEKDTAKVLAFDGCMFDYGFGVKEAQPEANRHWKSLGSKVTWEMQEELSGQIGWKEKYNDAIKGMTEICHRAANRLAPGIFRIDYTKGGRHGWKTEALVSIAFRSCLESDPMLTKDKIDRLQSDSGENRHDIKNLQLREQRIKGSPLSWNIPDGIKRMGAGSAKCMKLLAGLSHNRNRIVLPSTAKIPVRKSSKKDSHTQCLQAKDYEGCMRFNSSMKTVEAERDDCDGKLCIIKTKGVDVYGLPKPVGWMSYQADDGRLFYFSRTYRIPHHGQQTRYVGFKRITRYYKSPKGGSSGTFIGNSTSSTNCSGYGGSISCTTSGNSPTYIPGTSSTPGGVSSTYFEDIYDCKDDTNAAYKNGKLWIGWRKGQAETDLFADLLKKTCDKGSKYIQELPTLNIKM
ncbi:hypothetical protein [Synechococcus sp. NB0720_010]|uniref:hypothetical protein n=1 Tax=Synechococcus sp. NB0720_010 TaxID=2907159 RepID=UPI001FFA9E86|nr:hypothetical protein [Synechococcus sp. NB0720_010]UPH90527.1 hypothetical protein LY254_02120 [Synechococcus sp. NB0720_010]